MKFKSDDQRKAVMSKMSGDKPSLSSQTITNIKRDGVQKPSSGLPKGIEPEFTKPEWDERTVKLAQRRINDGKIKVSQLFDNNTSLYAGDGVKLTKAQQLRAKGFLVDKAFTSTGKPRTNSPFGAREESIINDTNAEVRLADFYSERGNFYTPLYEVRSKRADGDGYDTFQYTYTGGKIEILG